MAELVEGAPLLRAYTRKTRIVGSNPTLSAIQSCANQPFLPKSEKGLGFRTVLAIVNHVRLPTVQHDDSMLHTITLANFNACFLKQVLPPRNKDNVDS